MREWVHKGMISIAFSGDLENLFLGRETPPHVLLSRCSPRTGYCHHLPTPWKTSQDYISAPSHSQSHGIVFLGGANLRLGV